MTRAPAAILDSKQPYFCAECGVDGLMVGQCVRCHERDPAGAESLIQNGAVYGWSESNFCYERIGTLRRSQQAVQAELIKRVADR